MTVTLTGLAPAGAAGPVPADAAGAPGVAMNTVIMAAVPSSGSVRRIVTPPRSGRDPREALRSRYALRRQARTGMILTACSP